MNWNRIFIDMDGCLAEWKEAANRGQLYTKGYFLELKPNWEVIDAVRLLKGYGDQEIFILSKYLDDSPYAFWEKHSWLDLYLPEIDRAHRILVPIRETKAAYVPKGIQSEDLLLDDFTENLFQWESDGGTAIKLMNGINGTKGTWTGRRVPMNTLEIVRALQNAFVA